MLYIFQEYFEEQNKRDNVVKRLLMTSDKHRQILNPWLGGVMTKNTAVGLTMSLCHAYRTSLPQVVQRVKILDDLTLKMYNVSFSPGKTEQHFCSSLSSLSSAVISEDLWEIQNLKPTIITIPRSPSLMILSVFIKHQSSLHSIFTGYLILFQKLKM